MSAYAVFHRLTVNDPAGLAEYRSKVGPVVAQYGGVFVVRGGEWETIEGHHRPPPVIIRFPDMETALRWYNSKEYRPLRELRHRSTTYDSAIYPGLDEPAAQ